MATPPPEDWRLHHRNEEPDVPDPRDLTPHECERLLRNGVVGRVALSTPDGPHIVPVNYTVFEDTVVLRTSAYTVLGTYGRDAMLAFEVDHVDHDRNVGWSVVARGRCWAEIDPAVLAELRRVAGPAPWAVGARNLYLRMRWDSLTGRLLGGDLPAGPGHAPVLTLH